jgi:cyclase
MRDGAGATRATKTSTLRGTKGRFTGGLREVGDGTWAWVQPDGGWGEANAGLVVGEGSAALIDTLWDQRLAREMLEAMRAALETTTTKPGTPTPTPTTTPIGLVINTHSDGDHWWGNAEAPRDAEIVTSEASRATMRKEQPPAALARLRTLAKLGSRLPGDVGLMGSYVNAMLEPFAFEQVQLRMPDRAFSGRETETVGGRELRLIEVGPAHTPGDLIVHVPDAGVVFAADMLFIGVTPVMWRGPLKNWLNALDLMLELDVETFIPGHGQVCGRTEVQLLRDYWVWLESAVVAAHGAGRSPLEASRAIARSAEFERYRDWGCAERMVISVTAIHRALSGEQPIAETALARGRLFAQVAKLGQELRAR